MASDTDALQLLTSHFSPGERIRLPATPPKIDVGVLVESADRNLDFIVSGCRLNVAAFAIETVPATAGVAVKETDLSVNVIE